MIGTDCRTQAMFDPWVADLLFEVLCERVRREIDVGGTAGRHSNLDPVYASSQSRVGVTLVTFVWQKIDVRATPVRSTLQPLKWIGSIFFVYFRHMRIAYWPLSQNCSQPWTCLVLRFKEIKPEIFFSQDLEKFLLAKQRVFMGT